MDRHTFAQTIGLSMHRPMSAKRNGNLDRIAKTPYPVYLHRFLYEYIHTICISVSFLDQIPRGT